MAKFSFLDRFCKVYLIYKIIFSTWRWNTVIFGFFFILRQTTLIFSPDLALGWLCLVQYVCTRKCFLQLVSTQHRLTNRAYIWYTPPLWHTYLGFWFVLWPEIAEALAGEVTHEDCQKGMIYPPIPNIRKISAHVAANVAAKAYEIG